MDAQSFREDTLMAIDAIVQAVGNRRYGYRAPSWSINDRTPWAFEVLAELGFEYDSSIFPIKHDIYGMPEGPRKPVKMTFDNGRYLWEIPASTLRIMGKNIPLAGGGFFRHSPYWYTRNLIRKLNQLGQPAVVYIHPWEFDPDLPRVPAISAFKRFRMYSSTSILSYKFDRLLQDFQFTTVGTFLRLQKKRRIGFC
jgi:polysaccharide deacetylase family protein (PEP-CTERM system associated)